MYSQREQVPKCIVWVLSIRIVSKFALLLLSVRNAGTTLLLWWWRRATIYDTCGMTAHCSFVFRERLLAGRLCTSSTTSTVVWKRLQSDRGGRLVRNNLHDRLRETRSETFAIGHFRYGILNFLRVTQVHALRKNKQGFGIGRRRFTVEVN